ncbi:hypothetical protein [Serratia liquefaciens]|nr:hypothetical protein [Serratia liquefaciens]QIC87897.1 hypothetical protein F0336_16155 [Serratia liquefaciens]
MSHYCHKNDRSHSATPEQRKHALTLALSMRYTLPLSRRAWVGGVCQGS